MEFQHKSVLLNETIEMLQVRAGGIYIDGTIGGGGHSAEILNRSNPDGKLIGIDRDDEALAAASKRLERYGQRVKLIKGNFADIAELAGSEQNGSIDGILFDLGVSSHQIDDPDRGFSYITDAPLDMRMDQTADLSAKDVVNEYSEEELKRIIQTLGEERWAARIASFIVKERRHKPIETTRELEDIIKAAVPAGARQGVTHPARRTFQAIRMEVNGELEAIKAGIEGAVKLLKPNGVLAIITFHSLEDHLVKEEFRKLENPCICPKGSPVCVCGRKPIARQISRKPISASPEELQENPRAHSAHLRGIKKLMPLT